MKSNKCGSNNLERAKSYSNNGDKTDKMKHCFLLVHFENKNQ